MTALLAIEENGAAAGKADAGWSMAVAVQAPCGGNGLSDACWAMA